MFFDHLVTSKLTYKKILTWSILQHVLVLQCLPKFLGWLYPLKDIEQGIWHTIQDVAMADVIIILELWSSIGLLKVLFLVS